MSSKSNQSPGRRPSAAGNRAASLTPRPFRRRPWFLAATAVALAVWLAFLSLMAWQQWRQEKKGPSPLREEETASEAAGDQ
jgi:hypothetical protein